MFTVTEHPCVIPAPTTRFPFIPGYFCEGSSFSAQNMFLHASLWGMHAHATVHAFCQQFEAASATAVQFTSACARVSLPGRGVHKQETRLLVSSAYRPRARAGPPGSLARPGASESNTHVSFSPSRTLPGYLSTCS